MPQQSDEPKTMTAEERWEVMEDRERRAWVAEHVMGWRRGEGPVAGLWTRDGEHFVYPSAIPDYPGYVAHDYEVLKHARETWGRDAKERLWLAFSGVLAQRAFPNLTDYFDDFVSVGFMEFYEPGDWSKAAYLALSATEGTETR